MVERRDTRVTAGVGVILTVAGRSAPCITRNLSRGGMFTVTQQRAPEGSEVDLEVIYRGRRLKARARVVKQTKQGLGLSFVDVDDAFRAAIRSIMEDLIARQMTGSEEFDDVEDVHLSWAYPGEASWWKFWQKTRYRAKEVNVSHDGAALHCDTRPEIGDTILIYLDGRKDDKGNPLTCEAEVVRHTPGGFAVRFATPTIQFRRAISDARRSKFGKRL